MSIGAALLALLLSVQPVWAASGGRPVNPPPGGAPPSVQAEPAAHVPLVGIFALVPDTDESRRYLTYGDVNGWYAATGAQPVTSVAMLEAMDADARRAWSLTMPSQTVPPAALGLETLRLDEMRPAFGFDFLSVGQMLEAGSPPDALTYVNLNLPPEPIGDALTASGYTAAAVDGATLYATGDDYAIDLGASTRAGQLGRLNRIALLDDDQDGTQLLIGSATGVITQSLAALAGEVDSLADDRVYRTLADAVETGDFAPGTLVGLMVLGGMQSDPAALIGPNADAVRAQLDDYAADPLPPYRLSAFATYRDGADTYLTLILAPGATADPMEMAQIVRERLDGYVSTVTGAPLEGLEEVYMVGSYESEAKLGYVTFKRASESDLLWTRMVAARDLLFLTSEN